MSDFKVRGYAFASAGAYLREAGGETVINELSPAARTTLENAKPASWEPAEHMSEIFHAVAKLGGGDEEKAREHLEKCGEYQAISSTGTFLKLIMKVLTPSMFAKRVPSLWTRDSNVGSISVDLHDDHIVMHLNDMEALEHVAPVMVGYHRVVLKNMGMNVHKTTLHGWALDKPTNKDLWFSNHWS